MQASEGEGCGPGMTQGGGGGGVPTGRKNQKALECSKSGDVHVVYSSNSDEWGAMLASAYSALRNTYNPNRLLFHLIIPHTNDADELCSMIRTYAQAYPDVVRVYYGPRPTWTPRALFESHVNEAEKLAFQHVSLTPRCLFCSRALFDFTCRGSMFDEDRSVYAALLPLIGSEMRE